VAIVLGVAWDTSDHRSLQQSIACRDARRQVADFARQFPGPGKQAKAEVEQACRNGFKPAPGQKIPGF
jgi:hypothetical protein